jgi:hypothetical protein
VPPAAFRLTITAANGHGWIAMFLCGLFACTAPAASLLTAPLPVIFLGWTLMRAGHRHRIATAAAFCAGGLIPLLPMAWLFTQAPDIAKFNVLDFNLFYRRVLWPGNEQIRHDFGVAFLWLEPFLLLSAFTGSPPACPGAEPAGRRSPRPGSRHARTGQNDPGRRLTLLDRPRTAGREGEPGFSSRNPHLCRRTDVLPVGTWESCDDDEIDRLSVDKLFRHEEDVSDCSVYWQPVR